MMPSELAMLLPQYRCERVVRAAAIRDFNRDVLIPEYNDLIVDIGNNGIVNFLRYSVPPIMFAKYKPTIGDFLVVHEDGECEIVEKLAFVCNYRLV